MVCEVEFWAKFVSHCKDTLKKWGFPNFLAKKVKKSAFFAILGWEMMIFRNR